MPVVVPEDTLTLSAGTAAAMGAGDYLGLPNLTLLDATRAYLIPWNATLIQLIGYKDPLALATDFEVWVNGAEVAQVSMADGDRNKRADVSVDVAQDDLVRFRTSAAILGGGGVTAVFRRRA